MKEQDDMSEREVLGCPFCGGPAGEESGPCGEEYVFIIACQTPTCTPMPCATSTIDLDAAISAWNRRSPSRQLILEEAAKLRAEVQKIVDEQWGAHRKTVSPINAFDHFRDLNKKWVALHDRLRAALSHPHKEKGDE
jgi:5-methylcytosine-specific restriction endonuclease McrA